MAKGRPRKHVDIERGRRLKECIDAAGLSVAEFSDKVNMAEGSIRNIMSGQRSLTDDIAIRSAEILGVRPAYLLNLDNYRTAESIFSHPAFPFASALVDVGKRNKAIELYLSSLHLSIIPNTALSNKKGTEEPHDLIEDFCESDEAYLIVDSTGEVVGHCSEMERSMFRSEIHSFIEYLVNKLISGRLNNG